MFCPYCGESNEEGYVYCGKCGNKLPTQPGQVQGVPAPPPYVPFQKRGPARLPITGIVAGVLVLALVVMLGWIIFGRDKPDPSEEATIIQESAASAGDAGSQDLAPQIGQQSSPQQPTAGTMDTIDQPAAGARQEGLVGGVWQLALVSSEQVSDYGGKLPAEGHVFHRLELLAVNNGDAPASSPTGSFTAEWQGNTYSGLGVNMLQGYIPPGWPLKIEVFFDLPAIVQDPEFMFQSYGVDYSKLPPVNINELDSDLKFKPVKLSKFDKTFETPGKLSIKPTDLRHLRSVTSDNPYEYLVLDASVSNLSGYDLNLPGDAVSSKLSFQIFTPGNIYPAGGYGWIYPAAATAGELDANRFSTSPSPIPPGYTHDGSFLVRNTDIQRFAVTSNQLAFDGALLLVWMASPTDPFSKPTEWALYPLDENAQALVKSTLAYIDPEQAALEQAQQALQEDNWMEAASLFSGLYKAHPGNQEYARQLVEIQMHTGKWIFSPSGYESYSLEGKLKVFSRLLWAPDEAAVILNENDAPVAEGSPIGQQMFSPDGATMISLFQVDNGYQAIISDLIGSEASARIDLPVDVSRGEYLDGNVYTWSNDGRYLLLPFLATETRLLSIALLDQVENNVVRYDTCAIPGGEGIAAIAWSPDGANVAYADRVATQIGIAPLVGDECRSFPTGNEATIIISNLVWSADDQLYIALEGELKGFSLDGSSLNSENLGIYNSRIVLSPDQRYLAYIVNGASFVYDLRDEGVIPFEPSQRTLIGWMP